jgi:hypothetical protein
MPEGTFEARCPLPEKLPKTARDRARLATAHFAADADDLREMLNLLDLWPASDGEAVREVYLIDHRDAGPTRRKRQR